MISLKGDLTDAIKQFKGYKERVVIPAANSAINRCADKAKSEGVKEIAAATGIRPQKTIRDRIKISRSNYRTLTAIVRAQGRPYNLIEFVNTSKRKPGAFSKNPGVIAKPWNVQKTHHKTFIVSGRNSGKPVVVATKSGKHRIKGKWPSGWSKTIYGPGVEKTFITEIIQNRLKKVIATTWKTEFARQLKYRRGGVK